MQTRRKFLANSTWLGSVALFSNFEKWAADLPKPTRKLPIKIFATNWGFSGSWQQFAEKIVDAGYDGVEAWVPLPLDARQQFLEIMQKSGLAVGFLAGGSSSNFDEHRKAYELGVSIAAEYQPLYINTHVGRDFFSLEQNLNLLRFGNNVAHQTGVPVLCETHRGRCAYSLPATEILMMQLPDLQFTADLSHWCCVHESWLDGFELVLEKVLQRTGHIHARVGHPQGAQVNDPRAPEWELALKKHLLWWDKIVDYRIKAGASHLTFLTEFGPPNYLPTLPYTQQPVSNQWDINLFMMKLLRERYG